MHYAYEETHTLDERCYTHFSLSPEILMEHAGLALASAVKKKLTCKKNALFICGSGNNGADGMVAARLLHGKFNVALYLPSQVKSPLAQLQLERAKKLGVPIVETLIDADVYVDALFGSGLNRPLESVTCKLLEALNTQKGYKIACDIPSGILNDLTLSSTIFHAHETIVMGALKLCLLNDTLKDAVGKIRVASLGITRKAYEVPSPFFVLQKKDLKLPFRTQKNSNKGSFGHVAILQGTKEGAAHLAGIGAFHFGAGLVSLIGEKIKKLPVYLMHTPTLPKNASVILAGMGLEMPFDATWVKHLLLSNDLPLVIDASLCHHELIVELLNSQKPLVLTPHPKEFSSILSFTCKEKIRVEEIQSNRFFYAKQFSEIFPHVVLVLKGANTIIAHKGELFINTYGTPSLAKGGSGDVLAGMIGALIAQGYSLKDAAIHASLAHALVSKKLTCNNFALTPLDICKGLKCL
ncbi:bifunctional ADP-dependent NAD(P)H-hydrate dehydratase/NAD(P)H-hydrate epimerase [Sulfurospirillum barnesii]|uniref:NAD(P)H-hydrate epimerase n=1 Tax=Sulfurospirillum barnesii (strain ATCC 700032 / DSM 10660 / SES-3) TaxID=760154 RepID=I3Y066_SULBS|nr:bifunctional ADP-dependent NAD(P)H-hydrate dehydratase/NAD(P)H-hydrate epimerase [Sulfurospirillum barnesii]AFL69590.1 yjeF-like protein, hydroxyethylthiazole kinase-related protein [Sulfurospirillum barnesii SES-3]